jgi:hypothetical protein
MNKHNIVAEVIHIKSNGWKRSKSMQKDEIELNQWSNQFMVIEATFIYITDPLYILLHQFISKNINYETEFKNIKLQPLIIRTESI